MKILITGGTGFVGSVLQRALADHGVQFRVLDLLPPTDASEQNSLDFIQGDVRDAATVDEALEGIDAVVHLAAAHHDFGIAPPTYESVNVGGMQVVCEAMQRRCIRKLCFYSTVAVYGEQAEPPTETTATAPISPYGKTKLLAEHVCENWCANETANQCLIIRPTVIFGRENFANMYSLIRQIDKGKFVRVGKMDNIKSLAFIENIVSATLKLWLDQADQRQGLERFNYVDEPDLSSAKIVAAIYHGLEKKPVRLSIPYGLARVLAIPFDLVIGLTGINLPVSSARIRKLAVANTKFDANKIHSKTGLGAVSLAEAIADMARWYRETGKDATFLDRRPPDQVVSQS